MYPLVQSEHSRNEYDKQLEASGTEIQRSLSKWTKNPFSHLIQVSFAEISQLGIFKLTF